VGDAVQGCARSHRGGQSGQEGVDIVAGRLASKGDTQDAERLLFRAPHRHDDIGGAGDTRVARGPRGHRNAGHVEGHEDGLGAGGGQRQVDDRRARGRLPHRRGHPVGQVGQQVRAQVGSAGSKGGALGDDLGERGGEGARARDVGGSRTDRALVSASRAVGHHRDAAPDEQRTDPGRGSDLVTADAHEVQSEARKGDVHGRQGLGGVAVDEAACPVRERDTVSDRLNGADL
jgi:hypothetical protein